MAKAKKKASKHSSAQTKPPKAVAKKSNARTSLVATFEKELLKTLSKLHDSANKKLALLTKEMKKLKAKLLKTVAQKRAPLKKKLEKLQEEIHTATTAYLKAGALKKHLQKFEKDWIKKQRKKPETTKSTVKKKRRQALKANLKSKETQEEHSLVSAAQNEPNVHPTPNSTVHLVNPGSHDQDNPQI